MASEISICNMALLLLNKPSITALTEPGPEAKRCRQIYDVVREAALREFPWNFATRRVTLAALDDTTAYPGWDYAYAWPNDCLRALKLYNPAGEAPELSLPFEVAAGAATRAILTNEPQAVLIYSADITDPHAFDALFTEALAYRLAAGLAIPLTNDVGQQQNLLKMFAMLVDRAKAVNANEQFVSPNTYSSLLEARR